MYTFRNISFFILPLLAFFNTFGRANSETCKDDHGRDITSCSRCLWETDCFWCEDLQGSGDFARGCLKDSQSSSCEERKEGGNTPPKPLPNALKDRSPQLMPTLESLIIIDTHPVDVYFLMDSSKSMKDSRDNLISASKQIALKIETLTSDFTIGFGSYNDKPTFPFSKEKNNEEYGINGENAPYAFRHEMDLTRNVTKFEEAVKDLTLIANVDSPESGLDAIAQALLCDEGESNIIGWRTDKQVQKVIIVITDQEMHYAGDGLMGGIVRPFDMKCHTSASDPKIYTKQLDLDYPSFGQIRDLRRQKGASIVFLVSNYKKELYKDASLFLQDDIYVDDYKSGDFSKLVRDQYEKIKGRVTLKLKNKDKLGTTEVSVRSNFTNCETNGPDLKCSKVDQHQTIHATISFEIDQSFCKEEKSQSLEFYLAEFPKDTIMIKLGCETCNCTDYQDDSFKCYGNGTFVCGGCDCKSGFSGKQCKCDLKNKNVDDEADLEDLCGAEGSNTDPCNGRGKCRCGQCQCDPGYVGKFCQCDRDKCPKVMDKICNNHGVCSCEENGQELTTSCNCNSGWDGPTCACEKPNNQTTEHIPKSCKDLNGQKCFGKGECDCNENGWQCNCQPGYEGKFCQFKTSKNICKRLAPCVFAEIAKDLQMPDDELEAQCKIETYYQNKQLFGKDFKKACTCSDNQFRVRNFDEKCPVCKDNYKDNHNVKANENTKDDDIEYENEIGDENDDITTSITWKCFEEYAGCNIHFKYPEAFDKDTFYQHQQDQGGDDVIYVKYISRADDENEDLVKWIPQISCKSIPVEAIIGASGGLLLATIIIAVIVTVVIINIRDYQEYLRYEEEKKQLKWSEFQNPLFIEPSTQNMNPMHGK